MISVMATVEHHAIPCLCNATAMVMALQIVLTLMTTTTAFWISMKELFLIMNPLKQLQILTTTMH